MASLRDVRVALREQLETINGLRAYDVWPQTINPPVAIVRPVSGMYHDTFDNDVTMRLEVTVLLQLSAQGAAQEDLDAYIDTAGDYSVPTALEANPSLSGVVDGLTVTGWRDYGVMRVGADVDGTGADYLGVRFDVEILA